MKRIIKIIFRLLFGFMFCAFSTVLAVKSNLGLIPLDVLMVALVKTTEKSISLIRFCIELGVLSMGWVLGGTVGVGTIIIVIGIGPCVQLIFKIFKFNVSEQKHRSIKDCYLFVDRYIN